MRRPMGRIRSTISYPKRPSPCRRDLRLILDSVPALVNTMTPTGAIDFANRQLLDYLGVSLEQLQDWPPFIHESDRAMVIERWTHVGRQRAALRSRLPASSFRRRVSLVPWSCRAGARAGWLDRPVVQPGYRHRGAEASRRSAAIERASGTRSSTTFQAWSRSTKRRASPSCSTVPLASTTAPAQTIRSSGRSPMSYIQTICRGSSRRAGARCRRASHSTPSRACGARTARIDGSWCGRSWSTTTTARLAGTAFEPTSTTEEWPRMRCGKARRFCSKCSGSAALEAGATIWQRMLSRARRRFSVPTPFSLVRTSRGRRSGLTDSPGRPSSCSGAVRAVHAREDRLSGWLSHRPSGWKHPVSVRDRPSGDQRRRRCRSVHRRINGHDGALAGDHRAGARVPGGARSSGQDVARSPGCHGRRACRLDRARSQSAACRRRGQRARLPAMVVRVAAERSQGRGGGRTDRQGRQGRWRGRSASTRLVQTDGRRESAARSRRGHWRGASPARQLPGAQARRPRCRVGSRSTARLRRSGSAAAAGAESHAQRARGIGTGQRPREAVVDQIDDVPRPTTP